jgi:hypothetical protein
MVINVLGIGMPFGYLRRTQTKPLVMDTIFSYKTVKILAVLILLIVIFQHI